MSKFDISNHLRKDFSWFSPKSKWSYSRLRCYLDCPRQFKYTYIDHYEPHYEKSSLALVKGSYLHSLCESYINKEIKNQSTKIYNPFENEEKLPVTLEEYSQWVDIWENLKSSIRFKELIAWAKDNQFLHTEYKIDYKNLFLGYIDLLFIHDKCLYIIDWKTGKSRNYDFKQVSLYAYALLETLRSEVNKVYLQYFFVEDPAKSLTLRLDRGTFLNKQYKVLTEISDEMEQLRKEPDIKGYCHNDAGWARSGNPIGDWKCLRCPMHEHCLKDYNQDLRSLSIRHESN